MKERSQEIEEGRERLEGRGSRGRGQRGKRKGRGGAGERGERREREKIMIHLAHKLRLFNIFTGLLLANYITVVRAYHDHSSCL